jgi:hypothetical protein
MTSSVVDKIKLWIFPSMVSLIGIFIYAELKELKSDVKALLAQSNIDKTRIDNLERELYGDERTAQADPHKQKYPPRPLPIMLLECLPPKNETDEEEEELTNNNI